MIFLENLQAKDISSKFAENVEAASFANNNFLEVLVVNYRLWTSQKKYPQNMVWFKKGLRSET